MNLILHHQAFDMKEKRQSKLSVDLQRTILASVMVSFILAASRATYSSEPEDVIYAKSSFRLGEVLLKGLCCERYYESVRMHLERAREQEHDLKVRAWSCVHLAKIYRFGDGVEKNVEKVQGYLKTSCEIAAERKEFKEIIAVAEILKKSKF